MRIAFALLVHRDPQQVVRLITKLAAPGVRFYIHIDKKVEEDPAFSILSTLSETLIVERSVDVHWGGYSIVEATMCLLKAIIYDPKPTDQIVLLSGQCYPIKSNLQIQQFFRAHKGQSFMYSEPSDSPWWKAAYARFEQFHPTDWQFKGRYRVARIINKLMPIRNFPMKGKMYGGPGSGWWSISMAHARYLLDQVREKKELEKFSRSTWAPDEFFLQTILFNSPMAPNVNNRLLWYMHWSEGYPSPDVLLPKHYPDLIKSDALFARKASLGESDELLEMIDEHISRSEPAER